MRWRASEDKSRENEGGGDKGSTYCSEGREKMGTVH